MRRTGGKSLSGKKSEFLCISHNALNAHVVSCSSVTTVGGITIWEDVAEPVLIIAVMVSIPRLC